MIIIDKRIKVISNRMIVFLGRYMILICDVVNLVVGSWGLLIFMKISGMAIECNHWTAVE